MRNSTLLILAALGAAGPSVSHGESSTNQAADVVGLDRLVVTASRSLQPLSETPTRIELISGEVADSTPSITYADLLKKNSSVDVIQYPSGLSGVGLRGFRPDYSGTNQHVLVLVDGHPTGATSLGSMGLLNIDRVEVLKGPASSLYGSSAMGGVVNFVTKHSSGDLSGSTSVGYGSFDTYEGVARLGGGNPDKLDFDAGLKVYQRNEDYRLGNGEKWANTQLKNYVGSLRFGRNLGKDWRVDLDANSFLSRNVQNPGGYSFGNTNWSYADWDQFSGNLRLSGTVGDHALQLNVYRSFEEYNNYTEPSSKPAYLYYVRNTNWAGASVQDAWQVIPELKLIGGLDYQSIKQDYESYSTTGSGVRAAPSSPNDTQLTNGYYLESVTKLFSGKLILNAGARYDAISLKTRTTPYATTLTPQKSTFNTYNPRAGLVYSIDSHWRVHSTLGTAFIAPTSAQTASRYDKMSGSQRQITTGNPDLKPESSTTWDIGTGCEYSWFAADVTYFHTKVEDKITTVYLVNTPTLRQSTYVNANSAKQNGLEAQIDFDLSGFVSAKRHTWQLNFSGTKMLDREQTLSGAPSVITNVADFKFNAGLQWHQGPWKARVSARYVHGMWDNDYTTKLIYTNGKGGIFEYPTVLVWDANIARSFGTHHEVSLNAENLFDRYYYEKNDYPQPGLTLFARYRFSF